MQNDTMSEFEMAVLAAQTRANIARLREFTTFQPHDETAFDRVANVLAGLIPGQSAPRQPVHSPVPMSTTAPAPASAAPAAGATQDEAGRALADLRAAHPTLAAYMNELRWVTRSGDLQVFRHSRTQRSLTFDPRSKVISGTLDNGETSHDAATVLRVISTI
jgi:hypothetical protein